MTTTTGTDTVPKRLAWRPFRALGFLARCYDRYQQRLDLAELTDEALQDIGLTRRDVERECAQSFWR